MKKILLFSVFLIFSLFGIKEAAADLNDTWKSTVDGIKSLPEKLDQRKQQKESESRGGTSDLSKDSNVELLQKKSVLSGPGFEGGHRMVRHKIDSGISKEKNIKNLIIGWMNVLLSLSALLATVAIVWAGTLYVTAAGDDSAHEKAKKIIIYVAIGIILTLGSYAIVNTIMQARLGA